MTEQPFAHYRIEEQVRQSSLGTVYRAFDVEAERPVWLHLLSSEVSSDDDFRGRLLETMEAVSQLRHPSIAPVVDHGEVKGRLYIATAAPLGRPLSAFLDVLSAPAGRVSLRTLLAVIINVGEALAYAHEQGVVHGAVSPDNVFVARSGKVGGGVRAVLVAAGVATVAHRAGKEKASSLARRLPYMSPEGIRRRPLDARSDVYSLGMLLYRLATGRLPFSTESLKLAARSYLLEQPPPPQSFYGELPDAVAAIIEKAIAKDPGRRFQGAGEMVGALRRATPRVAPTEAASETRASPTMKETPAGMLAKGDRPLQPSLSHAESASGQLSLFVATTALTVAPGDRDVLEIELVNRGADVDHVTLEVSGLPRAWVSMAQEFVRLTPGVQTSLPITIAVPKESASRAGEYPFELVARSTRNDRETASVAGLLEVEAWTAFDVALEPARVRHGRRCRVQIRNESNRDLRFSLRGHDPEERVRFEGPHSIVLKAGRERSVPFIVTVRDRPLVGRSESHPFTMEVGTPESGSQQVAGQIVVPPRLPTGCVLLTVGSLFVLLLVAVWSLFGLGGVTLSELFAGTERARPLNDFLAENWAEGFEVTSLTHDGLAWALVMSGEDEREDSTAGVSRVEEAFPTNFISEHLEGGYTIDALAHGADVWAVIMSQQSEPAAQRWYTSPRFPGELIDEQMEQGHYVIELTYGGGQWAVVTSELEASGQQWILNQSFPESFIEEQWAKGFQITGVAFGNGQWAVTTAALQDSVEEQEVFRQIDFPRLYIREQWIQGLDVIELAHGNGEWVVVTAKGEEDVRQRWHTTSRFRD